MNREIVEQINIHVGAGEVKTIHLNNKPVDGTEVNFLAKLVPEDARYPEFQELDATAGQNLWFARTYHSCTVQWYYPGQEHPDQLVVSNDDDTNPFPDVIMIQATYTTADSTESEEGDDMWKTLYEVTVNTGIFTALQEFDVPWKSPDISSVLDDDYYNNYSGEKIISPLVRRKLVDGVLPAAKQRECALVAFRMYGTNWAKEWATMSQEYDPIANYDMTEVMTDDTRVTEYGKTEDVTNGNTHTKTGTVTDAPLVTVETSDTVHGFNSSNPVPTDNRSESSSGTDETTYNTSDVDSGSTGLEQGGQDTETRNYELTRTGNIGVTTTQQLLQSERDLWKWSFFIDVVFPDIDRVMTIDTY